jgi:hypothetical protein
MPAATLVGAVTSAAAISVVVETLAAAVISERVRDESRSRSGRVWEFTP